MIESELDVELVLNSQVRWENFIDSLRERDPNVRRVDVIAMLESMKRRLEEQENRA